MQENESPQESPKKGKLSAKEKVFVERYLLSWNASKAAREAGYAEESAHVAGSRLLRNDKVWAEIEARLSALCMSTEEYFVRITEQARASLEDFIDDNGEIDLKKAREAGKLHLLESYEQEEYFKKDEKGQPIKVIRKRIKLHSVQGALKMVGERLNDTDHKKAIAELQIQLLQHKLEELQKKEALLDLIKRKASPEEYRRFLEILSGSDEDEEEMQ